jgi:hypothetical protein
MEKQSFEDKVKGFALGYSGMDTEVKPDAVGNEQKRVTLPERATISYSYIEGIDIPFVDMLKTVFKWMMATMIVGGSLYLVTRTVWYFCCLLVWGRHGASW